VTAYLGLIRKERGSDYGVDFPDFPGCISVGSSLEDASRLAQEALAFHVKGMIEDGLPIPAPSSLDQIDAAGAVAVLVEVPEPRTVRVNLTIPSTDLAVIDGYVRRHAGESRSALMVKGALTIIGRSRPLRKGAHETVERSRRGRRAAKR
jgi:predicted RNase H-like HicB family nuclease